MKISFNADVMLRTTSQLASIVAPKNSMPILDNIRMKINGDANKIEMMASDGETWLTMSSEIIESDCKENIVLCVNASDFVAALRNLTGQTITLNIDESSHTIKGDYNKGHFTMPFVGANEYPMARSIGEAQSAIVKAHDVCLGIELSEYAMASDEIRPILNGVHFNFTDNDMVAVSTDGRKLTKFTIKDEQCEGSFKFTLPKKPAHVLAQLIGCEESDMQVTYSNQNVLFGTSWFTLVTRLCEGNYPNYDVVIPKENDIIVKVNREELLSAAKRIAPMSGSGEMLLFDIQGTMMTISAQDYDYNKSASEYVMCEHVGSDVKICFNGGMFQQTVKNIRSNTIVMELKSFDRPCVFKPCEQTDASEHIEILMPLKIEQ
jgi:DNA polymerase-3 subunit beta